MVAEHHMYVLHALPIDVKEFQVFVMNIWSFKLGSFRLVHSSVKLLNIVQDQFC
jgi:hypothetical protein